MNAFDQLNLVAEIAAALLGFIAIFLALFESDGRFSASDRHFIQALVITSALAIIFALVPRSISLFDIDSDSVWRTASIVAVVLGSVAMLLQVWQQIQMSHGEAAKIYWLWHFVAWALAVCIAILFVLALVASTGTIAYYVSGVSLMVPLSLWVFVGVVFRRFF